MLEKGERRDEVVNELAEYVSSKYDDKADAIKYLDSLICEVMDKLYEDEEGILVLKDRGFVEPFNKKKMYYSIASVSDAINQGMNEGDINLVINEVYNRVNREHCKVVSTKRLREYVIDSLEKSGYTNIRDKYRKAYLKI